MMSLKRIMLAAITLSLSALPGLAQNQISDNQPVTRTMTATELRLQAKLKLDFDKGLIDSTQLAAMQRDFDGILVKEDDFKTRGMDATRRRNIDEKLAAFECKLDQSSGVSTTQEARDANGPKANKNNVGLSSVAPTN